MCGIVGFCGSKKKNSIEKLLRIIEHRGRDDRATYTAGRVHLGMNRLAIVDLRRGLYPIRYKHYILLYNGEIYNHEHLRLELSKKKIHAPTGCDAYVILPLFDLYGSAAFSQLEGMFALCIYDTRKKELTLARDKSGEKPLYFLQTKDTFAFASEVKALFSFMTRPKVRQASVSQYLSKGFVYGKETLVLGVKKLLASEYLVYNNRSGDVTVRTYWRPHITNITLHGAHDTKWYVKQAQLLIENSVKARMRSDVSVGCFISGGIDSALIARFASTMTSKLRTYSITFPRHHQNDESFFARFVADHLQTQHTEVMCTPKLIEPIFQNLGVFIDEPISDPAILPTLLLSQEARKSVKVVLTGEGADEVFAGYPRYLRQLAVEYVRKQKIAFGPLLFLLRAVVPHRFTQVSQELAWRYCAQRIWSQRERGLLNRQWDTNDTQIYYPHSRYPSPLLRMQLSDYRGYLSEQLFMKVDKSTMIYNLESRAPYVDTDIINFALSLPEEYKVRWLQGKYLLKLVSSAYFPPWFVWRPKHGFSVPLRDWFCLELKEYAQASIEDVQTFAPSVDIRYYETVVANHLARREDNADKIWNMMVLTAWLKNHKLFL